MDSNKKGARNPNVANAFNNNPMSARCSFISIRKCIIYAISNEINSCQKHYLNVVGTWSAHHD